MARRRFAKRIHTITHRFTLYHALVLAILLSACASEQELPLGQLAPSVSIDTIATVDDLVALYPDNAKKLVSDQTPWAFEDCAPYFNSVGGSRFDYLLTKQQPGIVQRQDRGILFNLSSEKVAVVFHDPANNTAWSEVLPAGEEIRNHGAVRWSLVRLDENDRPLRFDLGDEDDLLDSESDLWLNKMCPGRLESYDEYQNIALTEYIEAERRLSFDYDCNRVTESRRAACASTRLVIAHLKADWCMDDIWYGNLFEDSEGHKVEAAHTEQLAVFDRDFNTSFERMARRIPCSSN